MTKKKEKAPKLNLTDIKVFISVNHGGATGYAQGVVSLRGEPSKQFRKPMEISKSLGKEIADAAKEALASGV